MKTQWFEKHANCRANPLFKGAEDDFRLMLCDQCDMPIVVAKKHVQ